MNIFIMHFLENSIACGKRFMLGSSLHLGFLPLTGSAQLLGFFCWVSYQQFYGNIALLSLLDVTLVFPVFQLNISCISWVLTSFFHLTTFYWMFLEGNISFVFFYGHRQDSSCQIFAHKKL